MFVAYLQTWLPDQILIARSDVVVVVVVTGLLLKAYLHARTISAVYLCNGVDCSGNTTCISRNHSDLRKPHGWYCFFLFASAASHYGPGLSLDTRINYGLNWLFACKLSFAWPQLSPAITVCRLLYSKTLLPILLSSQSQLRNYCFCRRRKSGAFRFT